jgi:hypothetical protein
MTNFARVRVMMSHCFNTVLLLLYKFLRKNPNKCTNKRVAVIQDIPIVKRTMTIAKIIAKIVPFGPLNKKNTFSISIAILFSSSYFPSVKLSITVVDDLRRLQIRLSTYDDFKLISLSY